MQRDIERLRRLLPHLPGAYLIRKAVTSTNEAGKAEADYACIRGNITDAMIQNHFEGRQALAVSPFLGDGKACQWLVIDVDRYGIEQNKLEAHLAVTLPTALPLVPASTKSGGWHLYLFLSEPAASKTMFTLANKIRGWMQGGPLSLIAFGTKPELEVRPAQPSINAEKGDTGNFITLPLFNSTPEAREAFLNRAESNMLDIERLNKLVDEGDFEDGPCCLYPIQQHSMKGDWAYRNLFTFQLAVFYSKKYPSDWKDRVRAYNSEFITPKLEDAEIDKTLKSVENSRPHYTCNRDPFEANCNKNLCQRQRFGVNSKGALELINPEGLIIIDSDPPSWHLTMKVGGSDVRMKLTTSELQNQRSFKKRCMEVLHIIPDGLPGAKEWEAFINTMLSAATVIPQPYEMSTHARLWDLIWRYFESTSTSTKAEDLMKGRIFIDNTPEGAFALFRLVDFETYVDKSRSRLPGQASLFVALKELELSGNVTISAITIDGNEAGHVWRAKIPDQQLLDIMEANLGDS